ncbi:hypothetical protein BYT27DRAFT_7205799 [Phlegmacium glaucopus]|nr:hypothetical protein BYT27DRAFT_7205799 [Phlegmacium glaucopus]
MARPLESRWFIPFFLEDSSGRLTRSKFTDLYDRMKLYYGPVIGYTNTTYGVFDESPDGTRDDVTPIVLQFGADNSLGTITIGSGNEMAMENYLSRVTIFANSKCRHFVASDGYRYRWRYRYASDQEWACTDSNGEVVSYYSLKLAGEPPYMSSGCMLTVEEDYGHLACEMLATCMIMRHIAAHNL